MEYLIVACFLGIFVFGFLHNGKWASRCLLGLFSCFAIYGIFNTPNMLYVIIIWIALILGKDIFTK